MSEGESLANAIGRALRDLERGDRRQARQRLKSHLVSKPASMEARRLLAELYRADGYPDEAGRWGYLLADGATANERAAYERACAHRLHPMWTNTCVRRGLRWTAPLSQADDYAAGVLRRLDEAAAAEREGHRRELESRLWYRLARAIPPLRGWVTREWPPRVAPYDPPTSPGRSRAE